MCEFWGVSNIASVIIMAIDLNCIPKLTGLEAHIFKILLKVAFDWKNIGLPDETKFDKT